MRTTYRVLAYLIAALVAVQSAVMVFAIAGLIKWVDDGGVLDSAALESEESMFSEDFGFAIHAVSGMYLIPLIALVLLIVSFFAKVPRGVMWAVSVFGLVVVQVLFGLFGFAAPVFGLLHGLNALVLFTVALVAARNARSPAPETAQPVAA
jgi:heme A synthase